MDAPSNLVQRVSALRHRLAAANGSPSDLPETPEQSERQPSAGLEQRPSQSPSDHGGADAVERLGGVEPAESSPFQFTQPIRQALLRAEALVRQLQALPIEFSLVIDDPSIWRAYQDNIAITETVLRSLQAMPRKRSEQVRLSEALHISLEHLADRLRTLQSLCTHQQTALERMECLARCLRSLCSAEPISLNVVLNLAETIIVEAEDACPMHWYEARADDPARWAAGHMLNVAQVVARVARHDAEWRGGVRDAVLAALVFDAGMAAMPTEILQKAAPLDASERRIVETHAELGVRAIHHSASSEGWLIDAVRAHHERMDGSGYPDAKTNAQIPRLARLLGVCDVYAALRSERPHRSAHAPRAALTETLLAAEEGRLDSALAQGLLALSFYPLGTLVELSDGSIGRVVATNALHSDLGAPLRPVVQILMRENGPPLPFADHVNLCHVEGRHVVRGLTLAESRRVLGSTHLS